MYTEKQLNGDVPCYTDFNGNKYDCIYGGGYINNGSVLCGTTEVKGYSLYIIGDSITVHRYYRGKTIGQYRKGEHSFGYPIQRIVTQIDEKEVLLILKRFKGNSYYQSTIINRAIDIIQRG